MVPELPAGRLPLVRRFDAGASIEDRVEDALASCFVPPKARSAPGSRRGVLSAPGSSVAFRPKVEEDFRAPRGAQFLAQRPRGLPGPGGRRAASRWSPREASSRGFARFAACPLLIGRTTRSAGPLRIRDGEREAWGAQFSFESRGWKTRAGTSPWPQCFRRPKPCQPRFDFRRAVRRHSAAMRQTGSASAAARSLSSRSVSARRAPTRQRSASR